VNWDKEFAVFSRACRGRCYIRSGNDAEVADMRKTALLAIGLALGLAPAAFSAQAQNLDMPAGTTATAYTAMPQRGASMADVERRFGAPQRKVEAVGQPPISRWVYGDFVVYFEHSLVLHSVRTSSTSG
jgi:hypothetical protein